MRYRCHRPQSALSLLIRRHHVHNPTGDGHNPFQRQTEPLMIFIYFYTVFTLTVWKTIDVMEWSTGEVPSAKVCSSAGKQIGVDIIICKINLSMLYLLFSFVLFSIRLQFCECVYFRIYSRNIHSFYNFYYCMFPRYPELYKINYISSNHPEKPTG